MKSVSGSDKCVIVFSVSQHRNVITVTVAVDIFIGKYYFHRFELKVIQLSNIVLNKLLSCKCDLIQLDGIDGSLCGVLIVLWAFTKFFVFCAARSFVMKENNFRANHNASESVTDEGDDL